MKKINYSFLSVVLLILGILFFVNFQSVLPVGGENYKPILYASVYSLIPPILAMVLALITKEVYFSLFFGGFFAALFYSNGNLESALNAFMFQSEGGLLSKVSDTNNVGILFFIILLGMFVSLINKTGGSEIFATWSSKHVKSKIGAEITSVLLGIFLFIDDYFLCLTVGSVMKPIAEKQKVSKTRLAYIVDSTAAPICILAPISTWSVAVATSIQNNSDVNGFTLFLKSIPFNLYALLTLTMILYLIFSQKDFGLMKKYALKEFKSNETDRDSVDSKNGKIIDLILPVLMLIILCFMGILYKGGFFNGASFKTALENTNASQGLVLGSIITLIFTFIFYVSRNVLSFKDFMNCLPEGFKAMVSPIVVLSLAWTLSGLTNLLGAKQYIEVIVANSATELQIFLPFFMFLIASFLSFSTGTSWGTFAILIPIICSVFPGNNVMLPIAIAACLSGSVFGDHCSPISDTTIIASAGCDCPFLDHVVTQLPYAMTVATVSSVGFLFAGFVGFKFQNNVTLLTLPISICILFIALFFIIKFSEKKELVKVS